jgi:tetratricopeptide (TPR) repeat protein
MHTMATATPTPSDILRQELEQLFDLGELHTLSRDLLGLQPDDVAAGQTKPVFARALVERCFRDDLQEGLADAITMRHREAASRLLSVYEDRPTTDLVAGTMVDGLRVTKRMHDEGISTVYAAQNSDGKQTFLKVLRDGRARDRRGLQRFLVAQRALKAVDHSAIQRVVGAGVLSDGRAWLAYEQIDGQLLSARLGRAGAMHINEARGLLQALCEGLDSVHAAGIAHGDIRADHVMLVRREGQLAGVLVDFAVDRLMGTRPGPTDATNLSVLVATARGVAPERIRRGAPADAKSDVYAMGALTWEILTGKPLFANATGFDLVLAHLSETPEAPSKVAPRGWVAKEIDGAVLKALAKSPDERYASTGQFFHALMDALKGKRTGDITREEFETRKTALLEVASDEERALALESSGTQGIAWAEVVEAFKAAIEATSDDGAKKSLRFRAARVFEAELKDLSSARGLYQQIVDSDPTDEVAKARAHELRKAVATPDEKAEIILEEIDGETSATERARLLVSLAKVYEREIKDSENALLAYVHALTETPSDENLASEVERLTGEDTKAWGETLSSLSEGAKDRDPADAVALYVRAGRWYDTKMSRPEYALSCYNQALGVTPTSNGALEGAAGIYRKQSQWAELVSVLLKRADAQGATARGRDARAEAADVTDSKLNDSVKARETAERVLAEDASHAKANEVVERICLRAEDWSGVIKLLTRKADAMTSAPRADALCEIAEVYEDRLSDATKAAEFFEQARDADATHMASLKGLERLYARAGNHEKLLKTLESQIPLVTMARQKVELHNRVGALLEEEFVDHTRAATAFEEALKLDTANDAALRGLGRLYRVLGRWEDLATLLERHASIVDDVSRKTELLVLAGRVLIDPIGAVDRAQRCFERALEVDKGNATALEGIARVAALKGDTRAAVDAYESLAQSAKSPAEKLDILLKLARVLEDRGDRDAAIERYKQCLDVDPDSAVATARLRELYAARGDAQGAIELLQREIEAAEGSNQRANLWTQVAKIYRDRVKDNDKTRNAAEKAQLLDSTQDEAGQILGELAFAEEKWADAVRLLAPRAGRAKDLGRAEGLPLALRYGQALARSGDNEKALAAFRTAKEIAPDDRDAQLAVAHAAWEASAWTEAAEGYGSVLRAHGKDLESSVRASATFEYADALKRSGRGSDALKVVAEALETDGQNANIVNLATTLYGEEGRWDEVVKLKRKRVEQATTETERFEGNLELGELLATRLGEKAKAAKAYAAALEIRPDDRKLLTRLMQLYSDEKDWGRLVEVVLRLAERAEEKTLQAKYYLTAAQLSDVHLHRTDEATDYYEQALELDPSQQRALDELATLRGAKNDWAGLEKSYRKILGKLPESAPKSSRARLHGLLAGLYENKQKLNQPAEAVAEYEKAMEIAPGEVDHSEQLAELYTSDTKRYFDRLTTTHRGLLEKNPTRVESLHALRKAFTEARKPDEAWCLCQALVGLKSAEPEEENFFKKFRTDKPAEPLEKMNDERWARDLVHPMQDALLTSLFATILPAVLRSRSIAHAEYGLTDKNKIDPAVHDAQMARTVHYAAGVLGLKTPTVYAVPSHDSGLNFAATDPPTLFLGATALAGGPSKALAFLAGVRLSNFRPGHQVRQIVATGTGLRAWLLAAIRSVQPGFPVSEDLATPVKENLAVIKSTVQGQSVDVLSSIVSKLVQSDTSLDLKRWTSGVDLTADRAGFLLANDLQMSLAVIRATAEDQSSVPQADRISMLRQYAISEEYFRLRQRLGIAMVVGEKKA